jgi:hypothetical protein
MRRPPSSAAPGKTRHRRSERLCRPDLSACRWRHIRSARVRTNCLRLRQGFLRVTLDGLSRNRSASRTRTRATSAWNGARRAQGSRAKGIADFGRISEPRFTSWRSPAAQQRSAHLLNGSRAALLGTPTSASVLNAPDQLRSRDMVGSAPARARTATTSATERPLGVRSRQPSTGGSHPHRVRVTVRLGQLDRFSAAPALG